ncbi:hypothetical protein D3C74_326790 [compost metagenome]
MVRDEENGSAIFHVLYQRRLFSCFEGYVRFGNNEDIVRLQSLIGDRCFPEIVRYRPIQRLYRKASRPQSLGKIREPAVDNPVRSAGGLAVSIVKQYLLAGTVR